MVVRLFRELSFFELHLVQQPLATTKKACVTAGSSIQTAANDNFNGGDVVPARNCMQELRALLNNYYLWT